MTTGGLGQDGDSGDRKSRGQLAMVHRQHWPSLCCFRPSGLTGTQLCPRLTYCPLLLLHYDGLHGIVATETTGAARPFTIRLFTAKVHGPLLWRKNPQGWLGVEGER